MDHAHSEKITKLETVESWKLWVGVLVGPLVWITHLVVGYSTEEWFACSPSATSTGEIVGLSVHQFIVVITIVAAALVTAAGAIALSSRRQLTAQDDAPNRGRWMATVGVMNSVLYLLIILGGAAPLLLDVCETSP
jgi:hypothetical protein